MGYFNASLYIWGFKSLWLCVKECLNEIMHKGFNQVTDWSSNKCGLII